MAQDDKTSHTGIKRITDPQNVGRRKAVKAIAGGVGALVAYHALPARWERPIIEQVFLPAHAQTSGDGYIDPSIPVTEGHPSHPDFPHHPSSPSHPHNDPSAIIVTIGLTYINVGRGIVDIDAEFILNRIAEYTFAYKNVTLAGSAEYLTYINSTIPKSLSPNRSVSGSPGDVIEVSVTNNVNSEVVSQTAIVPGTAYSDFTITSGATSIVLITTANSPPNSSGDRTTGTIDLGNGANGSVDHEYNTSTASGGLVTNTNYSQGTYTLNWSNSGSTASEASLSVGTASQTVTFDPRNNKSWVLEAT